MPDNDIVTELPAGFLKTFEAEILATIPEEKVKADLRQAEIGRVLLKEGGQAIAGLGQKLGTIDARIWHRWNAAQPGCWDDPSFRAEFFADNPQCRSPGWKPKASSLRHAVTFVDGKSISNMNGVRQSA